MNAPAQDAHEARIDLENKLSQIISQTNVEEQEYHSEQVVYEQVTSVSILQTISKCFIILVMNF